MVDAEYRSPGPSPSGLCWDGQNLWSLDAETKRVYRHRMDTNLSVEAVYEFKGIEKERLTGLAWDGENLWTVSRDTNRIHRYPLKRLKEVKPSKEDGV